MEEVSLLTNDHPCHLSLHRAGRSSRLHPGLARQSQSRSDGSCTFAAPAAATGPNQASSASSEKAAVTACSEAGSVRRCFDSPLAAAEPTVAALDVYR